MMKIAFRGVLLNYRSRAVANELLKMVFGSWQAILKCLVHISHDICNRLISPTARKIKNLSKSEFPFVEMKTLDNKSLITHFSV